MAGAVSKKEILDIQGLDADRTNVIETLKAIAAAAVELSKTLGDTKGLKDLTGALKALNQIQAEFTKFQRQSVDMAVKAERIKQQEAQTTIKNANAIKAEQQAIAAETQVRIKNSQAIAAEERATQASIRTQRLQQVEHKKTTSSFFRLAYALRSYIAAYVSIQTLMSGISSIFTQTKELDSLSFSMRTIIKDSNELAQTQVFLSNTAKNYGLNLLSISERYLRFRAATIQSNMTAKDTQKIFDSVSRAAAVLGLRTDEVAGVYLALEQMISKGKVTTEELRRQLGERLSGAFGIFASAVGVSTSKLDEMLKKGKIISADVLPKFADQLLKAYGIENVTNVDNLAAAQGRLNTQWTEFIKSLKASETFISIFDNMSQALGKFNGLIKPNSSIISDRSVNLITESVDKLKNAETVQERQKILTEQILKLENERSKVNERLVLDQKKLPSLSEKILGTINRGLGFQFGSAFTKGVDFESIYKDTVLDDKAYKKAIDNLKSQFDKLIIPPIKKPKEIVEESEADRKKRIRLQEEANKKELESFKQTQESELAEQEIFLDQLYGNRADNGLELLRYEAALEQARSQIKIDAYNKEIELNNKLLKNAKLNAEEKAKIETDNAELQTKINSETTNSAIRERKSATKFVNATHDEEVKEAKATSKQLLSDTENNIVIEQTALTRKAGEDIKAAKGNAQKTKEIKDNLTHDMLSVELMYRKDINNNETLIGEDKQRNSDRIVDVEKDNKERELKLTEDKEKQKQEIRQQIADKSAELVNAGFDIMQQGYANQLSALEETHKTEVAAAGENVEKRILADRKYEEEKKKIQKKADAAKKAQAAFSIAISTSQAIMQAWATLPTPAAIVMTALISALGAAELATVLSAKTPEYAKGTKNSADTFIAGEKGSEIIATPSGDLMVTPDNATLYSDPKLKGSTVIPHDETTKILANLAMNNTRDIIDMRQTNKYLSNIEKSFKDKDSAPYINAKGKLVVKKGSTTYIYN